MILTEDAAKARWCPMARLAEIGSHNRSGPAADFNCIASACMMWRKKVIDPDDYVSLMTYGYCGLAGKP